MSNLCPDCNSVIEIGDWPFPCGGRGHVVGPFFTGDSQIHSSDRVHVDYNPRTGDVRIPGRNDRPIHPKLAAEGYERKQLTSHAQIRDVERKNGLIHEASNYNANSSQATKDTGAR